MKLLVVEDEAPAAAFLRRGAVAVLAAAGLAIYAWAREALVSTFDHALLTVAQSEMASAVDEPDGAIHVHEWAARVAPGRMTPAYEKVTRISARASCWRPGSRSTEVSRRGPPGPPLGSTSRREHAGPW